MKTYFTIIGKIQKLKTKFKCLSYEVAHFENIAEFHRGIGDEYHFTHSKKIESEILVFNSYIKRDCSEIKHIGIIFSDLRFLQRVNNDRIVNILNKAMYPEIFEISIHNRSDKFDQFHEAEYLK